MIYLDHNATAPARPEVMAEIMRVMNIGGNPSSVHTIGRGARAILETSRENIARQVTCRPGQLVFTGGGTEANNIALRASGMDHLVFSSTEHDSILNIKDSFPGQVDILSVDDKGYVSPDELSQLLTGARGRVLVSVMLANNETGAIQPVTEIAGIVLERGGLMHCDAVQALGRMPFDLASLGADLVTIAAHKIGGPKGVGALIGPGVDKILNDPLMTGGGQVMRRRAGTENIIAIAGFATAAEISCEELADREMVRFLRDRAESRLKSQHPELIVFSREADRLENTSFMAIPGVLAEKLIIALDLDGIAISSGSACSSGKVTRSQVLAAMGVNDELAKCAFRVSFGPQNWLDDVDRLVGSLTKAVERMNRLKTLVGSQSTRLLTSKGIN